MSGSVLQKLGSMMYLVGVDGGGRVRRHLSQIKRRITVTHPTDQQNTPMPDGDTSNTNVRRSERTCVPPARLNYRTLGGP